MALREFCTSVLKVFASFVMSVNPVATVAKDVLDVADDAAKLRRRQRGPHQRPHEDGADEQ
jgi:hypothetical protein